MGVLAYLDPASGSMIAATAAAGIAGVGVAAKAMWSKQSRRFRKAGPDDTYDDGSQETAADDHVSEHD